MEEDVGCRCDRLYLLISFVWVFDVLAAHTVIDKPGLSFVVLKSILWKGAGILVAIKNMLKNKQFTQAKAEIRKQFKPM